MSAESIPYDALFSGVIGREYDSLKLINPLAAEMSSLVGGTLAGFYPANRPVIDVVELGGGTGITTLALLAAHEAVRVLSIDNEPTMQNQAKQSLRQWSEQGRLAFSCDDVLAALTKLPSDSVDTVASAYTLHNFSTAYRQALSAEIFRVLKPGGRFINGDRYALDDVDAHTRLIQQEVGNYFKVLTGLRKLELLEHWIVHIFSDESENHVMRESVALAQLQAAGFIDIKLTYRREVNALVTAVKSVNV